MTAIDRVGRRTGSRRGKIRGYVTNETIDNMIKERDLQELGYDEWYSFLGQKEMVSALLDRLRHRCHTIEIDGPSLRDPDMVA